MASGEDPVSRLTADGLPSGLVILAPDTHPVELHEDESDAVDVESSVGGLDKTVHGDDDVVFCEDVEEGISMVSGLSQFGHHLDVSSDRNVDEAEIIQWLREILVEDDYGKIDCKLLIGLTQKEFGSKKRKTRAWLKRAFPKSYLRRSDRNRWFCGISFRADEGKSVISLKDKEWIDNAVKWLQSSLEINPTGKERCSDVHHALTQNIGQASVHMAISAVKMVFPSIPRKTFARIAFYVGIKFKDASLGHSSVQSAASTLNTLSSAIKAEYSDSAANKLVVSWLQKTLIPDKSRRERIKLISLMIKKRFGRTVPDVKVARLVKKACPNADIRMKGSADGLVWGVRIDNAYRPSNSWVQKAVSWVREVVETAEPTYCENAAPMFELMAEKLGLERQSKLWALLQEAFPSIQLKMIMGCHVIFGAKLRENAAAVDVPEFSNEDLSQGQDVLGTDDDVLTEVSHRSVFDNRFTETFGSSNFSQATVVNTVTSNQHLPNNETEIKNKVINLDTKPGSLQSVMKNSNEEIQNEFAKLHSKISELEKSFVQIAADMTGMREDVKMLVKDSTKSSQQKDSLIIQLQQTLIMLCQQQLQKFMPSDQNISEQTLSSLLQKGLINQSESPEV